MVRVIFGAIAVIAVIVIQTNAREVPNEYLEVGGKCGSSASPTGPGGAWQVIDNGVKKICPAGTSCRSSACNCDNLPDGTITSQSWDYVKSERLCKRVGGQKCQETSQCMTGGECKQGICVCDKSKADNLCSDEKVDIIILH